MALAMGDQALIIDTGIMFPDVSMPGVDLVIPRPGPAPPPWLEHTRHRPHPRTRGPHRRTPLCAEEKPPLPYLQAALPWDLLNINSRSSVFSGAPQAACMRSDQPFELGPFRVDPIAVCHSVPDGVALAVTTPVYGVVIHSGDFKLDPAPIDARPCDLEKISSYRARGLRFFSRTAPTSSSVNRPARKAPFGPPWTRYFSRLRAVYS